MGRVLLSSLDEDALDAYFSSVKLIRFTDRTITNESELREIIAQVREVGYCIIDQESGIGLRSISVPIRIRQERVSAGRTAWREKMCKEVRDKVAAGT